MSIWGKKKVLMSCKETDKLKRWLLLLLLLLFTMNILHFFRRAYTQYLNTHLTSYLELILNNSTTLT